MDQIDPQLKKASAGLDLSMVRGALLHTKMSPDRLSKILDYLRESPSGPTAEIGVNNGGTTILISMANRGNVHYACDTFDGLVDVSENDGRLNRINNWCLENLKQNMFAVSLETVKGNCWGIENIVFVSGYFPESASPEMLSEKFSFVHIDVDTYQSTLNCFRFFETRMMQGGHIVMDDVLSPHCSGAMLAWQEIQDGNDGGWEAVYQYPPQVVVKFRGG